MGFNDCSTSLLHVASQDSFRMKCCNTSSGALGGWDKALKCGGRGSITFITLVAIVTRVTEIQVYFSCLIGPIITAHCFTEWLPFR